PLRLCASPPHPDPETFPDDLEPAPSGAVSVLMVFHTPLSLFRRSCIRFMLWAMSPTACYRSARAHMGLAGWLLLSLAAPAHDCTAQITLTPGTQVTWSGQTFAQLETGPHG